MAAAIQAVTSRRREWSMPRGVVCLTAVLLLTASPGWTQGPKGAPSKGTEPASSNDKNTTKKLVATGLDALKLPTDAVVVIVEKVAEGLGASAKQVMLSPAAYKKLMDRIAALERRLNPGKPAPPSTCHLKITGPLDGDSAHVRAEFKFKAEKDKTRIALGCGGASPQKPELDGKEALLETGEDGLVVEVSAGQHVFSVELDAAVKSGDSGAPDGVAKRVFKIELPRAAVTTVEIEQMPAGVAEARCNEQVVRKAGETVALGAAKDLVLSWVRPVALPADGPWLTADAAITARVEEKHIVTEALFTLQNLQKRDARWVLETPPQTEVELVPLEKGDARVPAHTIVSDAKKQRHTIVLKEPTGEMVGVFLRCRQPRLGRRIVIGPFQVLEAAGRLRRQQGVIRIKTPPAGVRLIYRRSADAVFHVSPAEITEKDRLDSVVYRYSYWSLPPGTGSARKDGGTPYLLELEARNVTGIVKARVEHVLELHEKEQGWVIQATTRIQARPVQAGVGVLEIQLPRTWDASFPVSAAASLALLGRGRDDTSALPPLTQFKLERSAFTVDRNGLTDPVEDLAIDSAGRLRVVFPEKKEGEFTLILKSEYAVPRGMRHVNLELPLALNVRDQGGEIKISSPSTQQLLLGEIGRESPAPGKSRLTISSETAPDVVEFGWRPFRQELPVTVLADVTFVDGKAVVQQRMHLPTAKPLMRVVLRLVQDRQLDRAVARAVARSLKSPSVSLAGRPSLDLAGPGSWPIQLAPGEDRDVVLRYELPVPPYGLVQVPLFEVEKATRTDTRVRVWSLPGPVSRTLARLEGHGWSEEKIERPRQDQLPILVLHGRERDVRLMLRVRQSQVPALASAVVDRALIRATSLPTGGHSYRARFHLTRVSLPSLDVELPRLASRIVVRLDGVYVAPRKQLSGGSETTQAGTRIAIDAHPESFPGPLVLEVGYQVDEGSQVADGHGDPWGGVRASLYPPILHGVVFMGKVRWQVDPAPGQLLLNPGPGAVAEQRWGLRGWLLAPGPALTGAELERWLTGNEGPAQLESALLCWQTAPAPLHLVRVARKTWLLCCSLGFLALGLGLSFAPLLRGAFRIFCWVAVGAAASAIIAAAVLWPGLLPDIAYGCEPGLVVLVPILLVQWMVQKRYRRQLVFMPGFTRLKAGSSLTRAAGNNRPTEPSTVDKQPAAASVGPRSVS